MSEHNRQARRAFARGWVGMCAVDIVRVRRCKIERKALNVEQWGTSVDVGVHNPDLSGEEFSPMRIT